MSPILKWLFLYIAAVTTLFALSPITNQKDMEEFQGPKKMHEITLECDQDRLHKIEASLSYAEEKSFFYNYTFFIMYKDHKVNDLQIRGSDSKDSDFSTEVKTCIKKAFKERVNLPKELPAKGLTPMVVKFPIIITPDTKKTPINEGYVFSDVPGEKHCYYFLAPDNWIMDNKLGKKQGMQVVFYPKNSTFKETNSLMYTRVALKQEIGNSIKNYVKTDLEYMNKHYKDNVHVTENYEYTTSKGLQASIYHFSKNNDGKYETIVYFDANETINYFVLNTSEPDDKKLLISLMQLINSYHESDTCKPCCENKTIKKKSNQAYSNDYKGGMQAFYDRNYKKAYKILLPIATKGDAKAQIFIGNLYLQGLGLKINKDEAFKWMHKAADQGHKGAQYNIAVFYEKGDGVAKDFSKAMQWYQKAALQGLNMAQYKLAVGYYNGEGITQDKKLAIEWLHKSSDQEYGAAQFMLAIIYLKGETLPKDEKKVLAYLQKAAKNHYKRAYGFLSEIYENGWYGEAIDKEKASYWKNKI